MAGDQDLALLLSTIYFSEGEIRGRKRLQKTVCILKYAHDIPFHFNFRRYFYGPYSEQLAEAVSELEAVGLILETKEFLLGGLIQYNCSLTKKGVKVAEDLLSRSKDTELNAAVLKLKKTVPKISVLETSELVSIAKSVVE